MLFTAVDRSRSFLFRLAVATLLLTQAVSAQQAAPALSVAPARARLTAAWAATAPVIDGRLNDAIWAAATPVIRFVQRAPRGGAAASQRSEVRIAYDRDAIYVGVRNFDTAPDSIAQQLGRRDADDI